MLCQICKEREATVHLTEVVDNRVVEMHLCEKCAIEKGMVANYNLPFADMLAGLAGGTKAKPGAGAQKCGRCGLTYEDFRRTGRLGCPECYNTFKDAIAELLKKIHGTVSYGGKVPAKSEKDSTVMTDLKRLRAALRTAVEKEEFEEAARLRDEIKKLSK